MEEREWLELRKRGIGGSDAAAIIGKNPYKTNIDLWEEKTGLREPEDISWKDFVQYGKAAEKPLAELFALDFPQYEVEHYGFNSFQHAQYPFIIGSLDGVLTDKATGSKGILEIKTTNILNSMHKEKWKDQIPDNYYIQCLHYLLVTGYEYVVLKAQLKSDFNGVVYLQTKHYQFTRKEVEADLQYLLAEEIKFWNNNVVKKIKPYLILPDL